MCSSDLGLAALAASTPAQTADEYRRTGIELSRNKSWEQAIVSYRKVLELEPSDATTHYNLALALKYKGDAPRAVEEFESTLKLKPKWAEAHYGLGSTLYDMSEPDAAMKELRLALQFDPANSGARQVMARIYARQNNY